MEVFVILLLFLCIYFWMQNNNLREQNSRNRKTNHQKIKSNIVYEEITSPEVSGPQVSLRRQSNNNFQTLSVPKRRQNTAVPRLNTGIPGLDGPGVYHRLFQFLEHLYEHHDLKQKKHQHYRIY